MKALIVDDSRATRRVVGDIMRELGYEVVEAGNGQEGLDRLEAIGTPDVIMVDWNMPIMNGLDFVKAVRSQDGGKDIPIIMVTTETELQRMALAFMAGVNEYIMKPFDKLMITEKLTLLGVGA